jgi:YidC/Oxa1 family membrane protein insertase
VIALAWWQGILNFLGAVLAYFYKVIPNYGIAIILLTVAMRVVLLPLGIKQIRSMQAMQTIQPKAKAIQQKYKGDRQKISEETMKLYKEAGVNPLGGCVPILLQFPLLIALFGILQFPKGLTHIPHSNPNPVVGQPQDSRLYVDIVHQRTTFLGANLVCSAQQAGRQITVPPKTKEHDPDAPSTLNCGKGPAARIPYYLFALAMIGTTYYQQRQMQRAQPPGASQQQQALTKFMPLLFGVWGFLFPAGLVVYWTTTNLIQIGQQHFMLPKSPADDSASRGGSPDGTRRTGRPQAGGPRGRPLPPARGKAGATPAREGSDSERDGSPRTPGTPGGQTPGSPRPGGSSGKRGGGRNGGDRKKRRKR